MATVLNAFIGYLVLLFTVRILSRRPGGQMTLFEFVIIFLVGGVAIAATVGSDRSVTNCAVAILTIGGMHRFMTWLKIRYPRIGKLVDGTPLVLLKDGAWQVEAMRGMHIDPEDVMAAARAKLVTSVFDIRYAVLERNGTISIIKRD